MTIPLPETPPPARWRRLPRDIWALGFASLFMDASSEMIHALLPLFMVAVLGTPVATVGLIEGIAEATAAITKLFSGALSDYFRRRKWLMVLGYGLAALTKPIFPLATTIGAVAGARFADRVGKGIRGAPRDALVADVTPEVLRGAAYGLRQALDTVGALIGPMLAVLLMAAFANNMRAVMAVAALPAILCVAVLVIYVREPEQPAAGEKRKLPINRQEMRHLPGAYWLVVLLGAIFTLARFSEAFLVLRAESLGLSLGAAPVVMIVMNLFFAGAAYPAGAAADRFSRRTLLLIGLLMLIAADVLLAVASAPPLLFVGAALWGLHMAFTQGLLSKLVADTVPQALRGTGFGLFNLVSGVALLLASLIAGTLWDRYGPSTTFWVGAAFALVAALGVAARREGVRG